MKYSFEELHPVIQLHEKIKKLRETDPIRYAFLKAISEGRGGSKEIEEFEALAAKKTKIDIQLAVLVNRISKGSSSGSSPSDGAQNKS
jgi:hypothetical protein